MQFVRPYKLRAVAAMMALIVSSGLVLALGVGLRLLVDIGFASGQYHLLDRALLTLFGGIAFLAFAIYCRFYLVSWLGERVVADVRKAVYNHVLALSPGFFEVTRTGEVLTRLTADTTLLQTVIASSASVAIRNTFLFLGGAAMLAVTSPKLSGIVALVVPLVVVPIIVFGRKVRPAQAEPRQDRVADVGAYVDESLANIRTVQAFGHEGVDRDRFFARAEEAYGTAMLRVRARAWLTTTVIILVFGAIGIILWLGARDVIAGGLSPGQLSAFVFYAILVAASVGAPVGGDRRTAACRRCHRTPVGVDAGQIGSGAARQSLCHCRGRCAAMWRCAV